MEAESGLRLLIYTYGWRKARLGPQALLEPVFIKDTGKQRDTNWDPTTQFSRNSARLQLCNCCHKLTNTWQNNKNFCFIPWHKHFLHCLRRTSNVSVLKRHFGISFCRAEPSPNRRRDGRSWARTPWSQGDIGVVGTWSKAHTPEQDRTGYATSFCCWWLQH